MQHLFTQTVIVKRPTLVESDYSAAGTTTYTTTISALACLIQEMNGNEEQLYQKTTSVKTFVLFCGYRTDINERDIVVDGSTTYQVTNVEILNGYGGIGHHLEIEMVLRV